MDASLGLAMTAVPLLALRFGASAILLGTIGWVGPVLRLPACLYSGSVSEKVGRGRVMVPMACLVVLGYLGLAHASSNTHILVFFTLVIAAAGAFYPPLQSKIGDVSRRGELTKNLGAFNIGWCGGALLSVLAAAWLVGINLYLIFYAAIATGIMSIVLVLTWRAKAVDHAGASDNEESPRPEDSNAPLLFVARTGHFTGFLGMLAIRMLFPKLGAALHWSEQSIAIAIGVPVWGMATGMGLANLSPWWRGKMWPQATAQAVMLLSALPACLSTNPILICAGFFFAGLALSIVYTTALYHGLAIRQNRGRNMGIHEALVSAGDISGCLIGGLVAQYISLRAPYVMFAGLSGVCLIVTGVVWRGSRVHSR